jgi:choice-of-anchor C domain-containing protein
MKKLIKQELALVVMLGFTTITQASLIENGSFEIGISPPSGGYRTLSAPNTAISGWTVSAGNLDWIRTYWNASDGVLSLDLVGTIAGKIEQTFSTNIGELYEVTFDMAGNPVTYTGITQLRVEAAGQHAGFSFNNSGMTTSNMGWVKNSWLFTAVDTTTTLSFMSLGNYNRSGPALDNVIVAAKINDDYINRLRKADLDNDGDVDGSDLSIFLASFGSHNGDASYNISADFDNDNDIDSNDLKTFTQVFGSTNLPIILNDIPILKQEHYANSIYMDTYVESADNIDAGVCVPVSFAMLFLGHYKEFGPAFPPVDISYSSQNTKHLINDITNKLTIPIEVTKWKIFDTWSFENTKIDEIQILAFMDNYSFTFESNDYFIEAVWDIEYQCSTAISNDQIINNVVERLNNNEPILFVGHITKLDEGSSGNHASVITGYIKIDGIEYFRLNDTYSNPSAHWYRIERGVECDVDENCLTNYCPIKLIGKGGDWLFEMKWSIAWPQSVYFTVLPKF